MPNLHVTDRQVMLYMTRSQQHDQESAAAMAGFSARTARRIDKDPRLPSQKRQPRTWRTRTDPLTDVWPRVLEMLKIPGMMAVTIFEDLQDEVGPEVFPDRVRRTLERRHPLPGRGSLATSPGGFSGLPGEGQWGARPAIHEFWPIFAVLRA